MVFSYWGEIVIDYVFVMILVKIEGKGQKVISLIGLMNFVLLFFWSHRMFYWTCSRCFIWSTRLFLLTTINWDWDFLCNWDIGRFVWFWDWIHWIWEGSVWYQPWLGQCWFYGLNQPLRIFLMAAQRILQYCCVKWLDMIVYFNIWGLRKSP